jgi:hypothetical protein
MVMSLSGELLRNAGYALHPLVLGVTGHRFLAEVSKLEAAIDQALDVLEKRFPGRPLRLYSALAEGADRLVAERLLKRKDAGLVAVLPLPKKMYLDGFATPASKDQFELLLHQALDRFVFPEYEKREDSYTNGARFILHHCQVLVALWDGQPAQGTAGTGQIVSEARQRGLLLVWIKAANRKPGTNTPTSLEEEQGMVVFEKMAKLK